MVTFCLNSTIYIAVNFIHLEKQANFYYGARKILYKKNFLVFILGSYIIIVPYIIVPNITVTFPKSNLVKFRLQSAYKNGN